MTSSRGFLEGIFTAPSAGAPATERGAVEARAGEGLVGDRHCTAPVPGGRKREVTLIAAETLDDLARRGLALLPGASRRQLVVRGVDLAALEGRRFRVGEVVLLGTGPCRPCEHLEALTLPGVKAALEHRGGLTARILVSGTLRRGDEVVELGEPLAEAPGDAP
jgi:MOSC domain-containing protein YiiM